MLRGPVVPALRGLRKDGPEMGHLSPEVTLSERMEVNQTFSLSDE